MKLKVSKSKISGDILVPGSKSHTVRAIAVAAMADGVSRIIHPLISGDTFSSLNAATAFGAGVEKKNDFWKIRGVAGKLRYSHGVIDMGNSGTSLRIFTGLASLSDMTVEFDGDSSLRTRPMGILLSALEELGVKTKSTDGKCPLSVKGPLRGGETTVEGKSSQFVTSLLFSTPLAPKNSVINVFKLNEVPYVEMTVDWLKKQEIEFEHSHDMSVFKIKGGQAYKPFEMAIPADFSTATFPLAAAAVTGGEIRIKNLDFSDRQGDKGVFSYFEKMGMEVVRGKEWTTVRLKDRLKGIEIDLNSTPDALPAMAAAACFARGETRLVNVPQARIKETDRIACMTRELRKMGADVEELEDGMIIRESELHGTEVESCGDHRIVMALAIAGMNAEGQTIISEAEAASVTYPDFVKDFVRLGAKFEQTE